MSDYKSFKMESLESDAEIQILMDEDFVLYRNKRPDILSC